MLPPPNHVYLSVSNVLFPWHMSTLHRVWLANKLAELAMEWRSHAPSGRAHGTYEIEKYEWGQWRENNYFLVPVFICPGLHICCLWI